MGVMPKLDEHSWDGEGHYCFNGFCPDLFCKVLQRTLRLKSMINLDSPPLIISSFADTLLSGVLAVIKTVKKHCVICGNLFIPSGRQLYCDVKCSNKARPSRRLYFRQYMKDRRAKLKTEI